MRAREFDSMILKSAIMFFAKPGAYSIMEAYDDPAQELSIQFHELASEYGKHYYTADVVEKASGDLRIKIQFTLDENNPESIDVGNIEPFLRPGEEGKRVHSSLTSDDTGLDLGRRGVVWMKQQIRDFARSQGFEVTSVKSSTRYTGARAFNNPGDDYGLPKHFDVDKKLKEVVVYECRANSAKIYLLEEN